MLIAWSFLSILWSPDKILAFYFSLKLLLAIGLFFTVKSASWRIDWKKIIFILMLAGTLQGALAIGQFLTQQDFASVILGTSQHEVFAGGTSVVENQDGRWLRAYGTFSHPNMLGGYLAIVLLLALWQELKYIKEKKYLTRIAGYIIIFSGLILSFSRSAWLIFAIGLFLIFISQKEKCKELKKIIFIFFLTALIWLSAFSPLFFSRVSGEDRLEQKSIDDRAEYVWQAKEIIKNNFWLGVGAGNYTWEIYKKNNTPIWSVQPVHNVFLLIFAELGVVGFLLFLTLLWQIFKKTNTKLYFLLFAFFILMFFDHWLWTSHFGILFFFLVMGIITKKDYNLEKIV